MTMIMYDTVAQQPLDPTIPSLELGQQMLAMLQVGDKVDGKRMWLAKLIQVE